MVTMLQTYLKSGMMEKEDFVNSDNAEKLIGREATDKDYFLALDGFVLGGSFVEGHYANKDHHENGESECASLQLYKAIKSGELDEFLDEESILNTFYNHNDEDITAALQLLMNPDKAKNDNGKLLDFLKTENALDISAGTDYGTDDMGFKKKIAWIFEPLQRYRHSRDKDKPRNGMLQTAMNATFERITAYAESRGEEIELETKYTPIGGGKTWVMLIEDEIHARSVFKERGINSWVSVIDNEDGTFTYPLIGFRNAAGPDGLYAHLNRAEERKGVKITSTNCWNGGTRDEKSRGGSPRETGSMQNPKELESEINAFYGEYAEATHPQPQSQLHALVPA